MPAPRGQDVARELERERELSGEPEPARETPRFTVPSQGLPVGAAAFRDVAEREHRPARADAPADVLEDRSRPFGVLAGPGEMAPPVVSDARVERRGGLAVVVRLGAARIPGPLEIFERRLMEALDLRDESEHYEDARSHAGVVVVYGKAERRLEAVFGQRKLVEVITAGALDEEPLDENGRLGPAVGYGLERGERVGEPSLPAQHVRADDGGLANETIPIFRPDAIEHSRDVIESREALFERPRAVRALGEENEGAAANRRGNERVAAEAQSERRMLVGAAIQAVPQQRLDESQMLFDRLLPVTHCARSP